MCLGVPGRIIEIEENSTGMTMGRVSFGGIVKEVCLAYTPDAKVDDFVVVHVGFAISQIDEAEAHKVFEYLEEMGELGELSVPQPSEPPGAGEDAS